MKSGPIIIIEDDTDDKVILVEVIKELRYGNKLIWFDNCIDALEYLLTTAEQPFIIFCDINLPRVNGLTFKKQIDSDPFLRKKSIPFLFYSTSASQDAVNEAYTQMTVQGFFQKENSFEEVKNAVEVILKYWTLCRHPNFR